MLGLSSAQCCPSSLFKAPVAVSSLGICFLMSKCFFCSPSGHLKKCNITVTYFHKKRKRINLRLQCDYFHLDSWFLHCWVSTLVDSTGLRRGREYANIFTFSQVFDGVLNPKNSETLQISTSQFLTPFHMLLLVSGLGCCLQVDVQRTWAAAPPHLGPIISIINCVKMIRISSCFADSQTE